jgi:hypothetical protein
MRSMVEFGHQTSADQTPFQDIHQALQRLREEDLEALPASAMGPDMEEMRRLINGMEAECTRRLQRFDSAGGYGATQALTAQAWLRWKCNFSPAAAAGRVAVARELADLPQATQAFADGDISYAHAAMIARTAERLGDKMESNAETILVTAAKELDLGRLRMVTVKLQHFMNPDSVREEANESHELRFLHLSQTLDGVFYINGRFDSEGGAILQTALNALSGPPTPDDKRSPKQRRADSLIELARQKLNSGTLPEVGGQKPHLTVTVSMATQAGMRCRGHANLPRLRVGPAAGRADQPLDQRLAAQSAGLQGQGLPVSRLRQTRRLDRCPSSQALGRRRQARNEEHGSFVPPSSPDGSRRGLAAGRHGGRQHRRAYA